MDTCSASGCIKQHFEFFFFFLSIHFRFLAGASWISDAVKSILYFSLRPDSFKATLLCQICLWSLSAGGFAVTVWTGVWQHTDNNATQKWWTAVWILSKMLHLFLGLCPKTFFQFRCFPFLRHILWHLSNQKSIFFQYHQILTNIPLTRALIDS